MPQPSQTINVPVDPTNPQYDLAQQMLDALNEE
jgi:hypothetical protein